MYFYSFLSSFTFHCNSVRLTYCIKVHFNAVAQLIYASSSWSGFVKAEERAKLQSILNKASRYGFLPGYFRTIDQLFESSDDTLFNSVINNPDHVLC